MKVDPKRASLSLLLGFIAIAATPALLADWAHFGKITIGRAERPLLAFVIVLSYSRRTRRWGSPESDAPRAVPRGFRSRHLPTQIPQDPSLGAPSGHHTSTTIMHCMPTTPTVTNCSLIRRRHAITAAPRAATAPAPWSTKPAGICGANRTASGNTGSAKRAPSADAEPNTTLIHMAAWNMAFRTRNSPGLAFRSFLLLRRLAGDFAITAPFS